MKPSIDLTQNDPGHITTEQSTYFENRTPEQYAGFAEVEKLTVQNIIQNYRNQRRKTRIILNDKMNEIEKALCINVLQLRDSCNDSTVEPPKDLIFYDQRNTICFLKFKGVDYVINYHESDDNKIWVKNLKFKGDPYKFYIYRRAR